MAEGQLGSWATVHSAQHHGQLPTTALQEMGQAQSAGCVEDIQGDRSGGGVPGQGSICHSGRRRHL